MNIFIDESGSFVNAPKQGSWNSVAAYMSPECDRERLWALVGKLKRSVGVAGDVEVKLKNLDELQYFEFVERLGRLEGVLYAAATDAGLNRPPDIAEHQKTQAGKIVEHKSKMLYQSARDGLQELSLQVAALAPQLYVQLQCQVKLIANVISSGVLYYVQRWPKSLGRFRWRIDQKNSTQTKYEKAFLSVTPAFLQSMSFMEPMPMLIGADYSAFSRFDYSADDRPRYLEEAYGFEIEENAVLTNIGMLMREDLRFVDSQHNEGVQVADLLASGIRRCLRREFVSNERAAELLGRLMVRPQKGDPPIQLLSFSGSNIPVAPPSAIVVKLMGLSNRSILVR